MDSMEEVATGMAKLEAVAEEVVVEVDVVVKTGCYNNSKA
jgi:hypothetical protein